MEKSVVSVTNSPDIPFLPEIITEPGIDTLENYRCKEYARVVCAAYLKHAETSGLVPIWIWTCCHNNAASYRLAESLGFVKLCELFTVEGSISHNI